MSDNRGWVYNDNGTIIYRASSLGSCIRSLVAARTGETQAPMHANVKAAMAASAEREDEAIELYEERTGHTVGQAQKRVELKVAVSSEGTTTIENSIVTVRGHIDGIDMDEETLLEIKWLSGTNFAAFRDKGLEGLGHLSRKYRIQRNFYGLALGLPTRMVIGNKHAESEDDLLIISDIYQPDDVDRREIERIVAKVEEFAEIDELPDCDANCREGDPFSEVHLFAAPTAINDEQTEALVARLAELNLLLGSDDKKPEKRRGLLGEREDIKDELKLLGNDHSTEKFTVGPFSFSVVPYKGREYVDSGFLKKEHPEVYAEALKMGNPYRVIIVKKQK